MLKFIIGVLTFVAGQAGILGALPHAAQVVIQAGAAVLGVLGIRGAATSPADALTAALDKMGSGWKTAVGAVVWLLGALLSPDVFASLPPKIGHVLQAVGVVLTALGLYHATAKAGGAAGR